MVELHCHLDGSLRIQTLAELLQDDRKHIDIKKDISFYPNMGITKALSCFKTTLSVLQTPDRVERATRELCEDVKSFGHSYTEIRFAPQLHTGGSIETIVDAAISGLDNNSSLILCGLYGESPEMLLKLVDIAKTRNRVVGIDLAGAPAEHHRYHLLDYEEPFVKAKKLGIGRTVHAGEGRSSKEIEVAINFLHAQRIGHGLTLLDDWKTLDLVLQNNVTIEACLTSNWHTGAIQKISEHPIKQWLKEGVQATICADNILLSDTVLPIEYTKAKHLCGLSHSDILQCRVNAENALFRR